MGLEVHDPLVARGTRELSVCSDRRTARHGTDGGTRHIRSLASSRLRFDASPLAVGSIAIRKGLLRSGKKNLEYER